jgi:hypothetical protein
MTMSANSKRIFSSHKIILKYVPLHSFFNWMFSNSYSLCILLYNAISNFWLILELLSVLFCTNLSLATEAYFPQDCGMLKH